MQPSVDPSAFTTDPIWPWSLPGIGWPALLIVAGLLFAAATWTYLRVPNVGLRRVGVVLGLRLLALLLILLALMGASYVSHKDRSVPSLLLVGLDLSESVSLVKDETDSKSRFEAMIRHLNDVKPVLERLQKEHNITVVFYRFGDHVETVDINGLPDSATDKRTDTAAMLKAIHDRYRGEKYLRGLLVLSDGADNVASDPPARQLASSFRSLPCPVHTFKYGNPATRSAHDDIVVTGLTPEPSIVAVKGKLTVRATVDALGGFVGQDVRVSVWFGDVEIKSKDEKLIRRKDNQVELVVDAPAEPGEIKVTLKVHDPNRPGQALPGELSAANNEMSTYVTVSREGLSVLLIERQDRFPEPQLLLSALATDKRIRVYRAWLRGQDVVAEDGKDLLDFDQQPYDVIILGDVNKEILQRADARGMEKIEDRVRNKRTGLMMMGGRFAFSKASWAGTPIENLMPVFLRDAEQSAETPEIQPTAAGLNYIMGLGDRPEDSRAKWEKLKLFGYTKLGQPKQGSTVMAQTRDAEPLLVAGQPGNGRTLAFAGDSTHRWLRPKSDGPEAHSRFWRQVVLWLAQQEKTDDNLRVRLDTRRLRTGDTLGLGVELQGKQGETVKNGKYTVKVIDPKGGETAIEVRPGGKEALSEFEQRGGFQPKIPGEYRVVASGEGNDPKGEPVRGENAARFLVYQDDAESSEKAANHKFLEELASAGGGQDHRPGDLKKWLERLPTTPLPSPPPKPAKVPDWRQTKGTSPFLLAFLLLFVQVLALEWFLRRRWGMV